MKLLYCLALVLPAVVLSCKVDGQDKKDGDKWLAGDFQMQCFHYKNNPDKSWETKVVDCIWRNPAGEDQMVPAGKTLTFNGMTGICSQEKDGSVFFKTEGGNNNVDGGSTSTGDTSQSVDHTCKYKGADKKNGETWIEGNFEMKCVTFKSDPKKAWEVQVSGCVYQKSGPNDVIPIGQEKKYGTVTTKCIKENGVTTLKTEGGILPEGKKEQIESKVTQPEGGKIDHEKVAPKITTDKKEEKEGEHTGSTGTEENAGKSGYGGKTVVEGGSTGSQGSAEIKCSHFDAAGNPKEYKVDEEWLKDLYYFSCIKEGDLGWRVIVSGCQWEQFDLKLMTGESLTKTVDGTKYTADCSKKGDSVVLGVEQIA